MYHRKTSFALVYLHAEMAVSHVRMHLIYNIYKSVKSLYLYEFKGY